MTSLADKSLLSGGDNKPPMLEKHLYDSWKSRMELYMMNRPHGRMILASVEKGPLVWPSITEDGVTRLKEYVELTPAEAIQADCDIKAINIILQGLPTEIYALVSQHRVAKDLWEKIKLLMQGTSLTKQERECKLYDEFDKFTYKKGETLHEYYLRFTLLLNDMNIYKMPLEQFQVNTKFLNTSSWTSSNPRQQATIYDGKVTVQPVQGRQTTYAAGTTRKYTPGASGSNTGKQRTVICYNCKGEGHIAKQCTKPKRKRDDTWFNDKVLLVQAQASAKIALMANLSRNGSDALTEVHNQDNLNYDLFTQSEQIMTSSEQSNDVSQSETDIISDSNIIPYSQYKEEVKDLKEKQNVENSFSGSNEQFAEIVHLKQNLFEQVQEKDCLMKTVSELKNKLKLEENRNIEREIDLEKKIKQLDNIIFKRAYWKATSVPALDPSHSSTTVIVEVPKELPTVSMVNTSLKELKHYLTGFDQVVKERTTATAITEGTWGTSDVQKVFYQMEQAVEQHRLESRTFEVKMNQVLSENERLLAQAIDKDIVKTVVNLSVNASGETMTECRKCLELETELVKKKDFIDKETYDNLCKCFTTLEKHCITLEADSQLNQEIFQQENSVLNQDAPSFTQLFELSELKAQSQAKDTVIVKLKEQIKSLKGNVEDSSVKMDMDEIETLNIELEHRVTKLVTENEHLKQTYKQLYDSIKPKRVQSKEQCDELIKQVNIKSGEISDLNAKLQEQGLVIAALKNELRKLKGKAIDNEDTVTHSVDPNVSKDNMEPITPKLLNKRTAHSSYIKHTQEEALVLRDIVEHVKANYPQDPLLESAFRYTKVIQDLLSHISRSCPSINNCGSQLIEAIPRKKDKKVRFAESLTSSENTKPASTSNIVSNKRVLHSTGVRLSTSASGSQPSGNTKNDRILQTPSSNSKNKVEAHPRNVKSSLNKKIGTVNVHGSAVVQNLKKQDNSDYVCINRDDCMSSDNLCVSNLCVKSRAKPKKHKSKKDIWKPTGKVFTQIGYIWRPTGRTFTIVGNACPLTRITTTNEVPSRKPIVLDSESPKPVVKLVYSRKPRKNKNTESVSKTKVVQIVLWYLDSGCSKHMTGDRSQLTNFVSKFLGTVKFGNDQVAKIMGFGDYQMGMLLSPRVYYVEGTVRHQSIFSVDNSGFQS
ncbi:retrovirus-related pol polyprotein from transposon TNT 1-94 [Tanacetum coccineum]